MNSNLSVSSQVIEYLKTLDKETTFTSRDIANGMKLDDDGPVTGLMSRLKGMGVISEVGRKGRASIYSLVGDLSSYRVHKAPSVGGTEGRHAGGGLTRKQRFINTLFVLVEEVEKMKGDLSDFTTKEILHELEKRTAHRSE